MKYVIIPALAGTLFLAGCAELMGTTGAPAVQTENRASVVVRTQVVPGGFRTAATPGLTADDIDHLVLQIFELNGTTETPVLDADGKEVTAKLTRNQIGNFITFDKLKLQAKYRIRAFAYNAPETDPENLISTTDEGSYVDVEITTDERPTVTTLKVKLVDVLFDGKQTFQGVKVTPGGYFPTGPVSITIGDELADMPLEEGDPVYQGMLDLYLPAFKVGMRWEYKLSYFLDGEFIGEGSVVQEITGQAEDGDYIVKTITTELGEESKEGTAELNATNWFPAPEDLREITYENVTVGAGTFNASHKFGSVENTTHNKQYMWLAHAVGMVQYESTFMIEAGEVTILQTLESFLEP